MRKPARTLVSALAAAAIAATACGDRGPTAPELLKQAALRSSLLGELLEPAVGVIGQVVDALVPPVQRNVPLGSDVTWSFWAGPSGATSSNSSVGMTIVIPRGALSSTKRITVTALAGSPVAYKFEPHGLVFLRPAYLTQNLRGTSAGDLLSLPMLYGAYFATDRLELNDDGLASVTEILPTTTSLLTETVTFPIGHFSGYIVASGRASEAQETIDGY